MKWWQKLFGKKKQKLQVDNVRKFKESNSTHIGNGDEEYDHLSWQKEYYEAEGTCPQCGGQGEMGCCPVCGAGRQYP